MIISSSLRRLGVALHDQKETRRSIYIFFIGIFFQLGCVGGIIFSYIFPVSVMMVWFSISIYAICLIGYILHIRDYLKLLKIYKKKEFKEMCFLNEVSDFEKVLIPLPPPSEQDTAKANL